MQVDRNGLEVLSRAQSLQLLATSAFGRVVVSDRALPAAFPVNFALLGEDVVFVTPPGSKLESASAGAVVAFEVDHIDPAHHGGWSVLVQGPASLIVDPEELGRARALSIEPWVPIPAPHFVRIRSELVSGRRLPASQAIGNDQPVCPNCHSSELLPVSAGGARNFVCAACAACWHVDRSHLRRVDPLVCTGCPFEPACTVAAARDRTLAAMGLP